MIVIIIVIITIIVITIITIITTEPERRVAGRQVTGRWETSGKSSSLSLRKKKPQFEDVESTLSTLQCLQYSVDNNEVGKGREVLHKSSCYSLAAASQLKIVGDEPEKIKAGILRKTFPT